MGRTRGRASPVARVILAPLPDALDMGGTAEVITVVGLLEPPALTGRFAGLAARGLRTVALAPGAARVRSKEGLAVLTLTLGEWTSHGPVSPQAHDLHVAAWREENAEEKGESKQAEEDGEETDKYHMWGRRRNGLHDNFNPAVSGPFLVAADTSPHSTALST